MSSPQLATLNRLPSELMVQRFVWVLVAGVIGGLVLSTFDAAWFWLAGVSGVLLAGAWLGEVMRRGDM